MSLAPTGGHRRRISARSHRSPAVRVSRRLEDGGSRLAPILVGPAPARLGLGGLVRRGAGCRSLDLGDVVGWGFFAFAFITQVTSATDVLRQGSFPIYPSRMALMIFVSSALALVILCSYARSSCPRSPGRVSSPTAPGVVSWSTAGPTTATRTA